MLTELTAGASREYAFDGFLLRPELMRLDRDGQAIPLPHGAFNTLLALVENRNRVVTKGELLERVWPGTAVEENNLNQCISALRKAFGDTRKEARFIATVPGAGYRFVMEVIEREGRPVPSVTAPNGTAAPNGIAPQGRSRLAFLRNHRLAVGAVLVLSLVVGATGWNLISRRGDTAILVVPIKSFGSPGEDSEYIRKGVATEIEAALARTPGLHVAAGIPESVLNKGDVRQIARGVNARAVLRGQIRESGDRLAFTFELLNPETNRILWSDQFGMKRDELQDAESRVVAGVFKAMEPGRIAPEPRKVSPAAHELYLRARLLAATRLSPDLDNAVPLFERAVQIDSAYADAYTGIADACGLRAVNGPAPAGVLEKARAAALRAVELDPGSSPAHAALGLVHYADWNWAEARREYERSLALNPYYSSTHHRLALLDYVFNNYGEAEAELKRAQELNPYVIAHTFTLAEVYLGARRYDDVIRIGELLRQNSPAISYPHFLEMEAYRAKGDRAAALHEIRIASQLDASPFLSAIVAISEGRSADARRIAADHGTDDSLWASVYAQLGDRERMLAVLRSLIDHRNVIVLEMKDDPVFDPYRPDPQFQELIGRLHLPESQ
jgi:DNA-binding winged helix-turn-helix (wHTH) protein/TolB-like protein/Tfp pilus assembly protein PilF